MGARPSELDRHPLTFLEAWRGHGAYRAVCKRVVDGDTLDVLLDKGLRDYDYERLRLSGVDAPEIYGVPEGSDEYEEGQRVKQQVEDRVLGEPALVRTLEEETFGRWVAEVEYLQDETWRSLAGYLAGLGYGEGA